MSKLEEARQIQQDAGRANGLLKSRSTGCVCPLGALAIAYGVPLVGRLSDPEHFAYEGVSLDHKQDIALLGTAAASRLAKKVFVRVTIRRNFDVVRQLAEKVWKYNDTKINTTKAAVGLFTKAIEIRDSGVQILEEGVEL